MCVFHEAFALSLRIKNIFLQDPGGGGIIQVHFNLICFLEAIDWPVLPPFHLQFLWSWKFIYSVNFRLLKQLDSGELTVDASQKCSPPSLLKWKNEKDIYI